MVSEGPSFELIMILGGGTLQKMYTLQSAAHGAPWLLAQMP
jgi:hypothetical protein